MSEQPAPNPAAVYESDPVRGRPRPNTIVRIWRTRVDPKRAAEYERFAQEQSLPMFQSQEVPRHLRLEFSPSAPW